MPQLDISSYPSQIFWLLVSFSVLFFILLKVALPNIASILQDRQQNISNNIDSADSYKNEAEDIESEYNESLKEIRGKASQIIVKAHEDINQLFTEKHSELDAVLTEQSAKAIAKLNKSREQALEEIATVSAGLSQIIIKKLSGIEVKEKDATKAVAKLLN